MHKVRERVICITPYHRELTEDKEYQVVGTIPELHQVKVTNDAGEEKAYVWIRFGKVE